MKTPTLMLISVVLTAQPAMPSLVLAEIPAMTPRPSPSLLGQPRTMVTGSGDHSPSAVAMVKNRARTLGDSVSGAGTRYFAVTAADLQEEKDPLAIVNRLTPAPVHGGDGVRRLEIVVDIDRPLYLHVPVGTEVRIGAAQIAPDVMNIQVRASIYMSRTIIVGE